MGWEELIDALDELETEVEYDGYFCSIKDAVIIVTLGSMCELKSVMRIHLGDDKNGIHISCTDIWNKADTVLRSAAGTSSLDKAGFTELLHDEIRCVALSGTDCRA